MRWLLKGKFKLFREQRGFTLFEVLVAVGILGLIGVGLLNALDTNSRAVGILDEQVVATSLATASFEAISNSTYSTDYTDLVNNITKPAGYDVDVSYHFSVDGTSWNATYDGQTLQKITIVVLHQGKPVLSMCTYKAS